MRGFFKNLLDHEEFSNFKTGHDLWGFSRGSSNKFLSKFKDRFDNDKDHKHDHKDKDDVNADPIVEEVAPEATSTLTISDSSAGYNNTIGSYIIGENGEIKGVEIIVQNVNGVDVGSTHDVNTNADTLANTGFFIIADGYDKNKGFEKIDLENAEIEFVYHRNRPDERPATIHDNAKDIDLVYTIDGKTKIIKGDVYHSLVEGEVDNLNKDGLDHALTTVTDEGADTVVKIQFEDLYKLGDKDYDDVVFEINVTNPNTAPEALDDALEGLSNNLLVGNVLADNGSGADNDMNGDALLVIAATITTVNGGVVTLLENGDFTYTPADGFVGSDSFDYTVIDGVGGEDSATVNLDISSNIIYGTVNADILNGTGQDDVIHALEGNDTINGGAGDDVIEAGQGYDTINGGDGNDVINADTGNDFAYGGNGNDTINGGAGNDYIYGDAGDDTLFGNEGDDSMYGGGGNDVVSGGEGNDILDGREGNDILFGDAGDDRIYGNTGDDTISGGEGQDTLWGNAGDDTLDGGAGNDTLYGYEDNDILIGGGGEDTMWGMEGADTFKFVAEDMDGTINRIRDFSADEGDVLDIADILIGYEDGDDISDYVMFNGPNAKGDVSMAVDRDGAGTEHDFVWVAKLSTPGGAQDAQELLDNGNLIA